VSREQEIRRRAELRKHLAGDLDALLEQEAKQQAARMAARAIYIRVVRARVSAGNITGR
jgi:hypothetical protein